jgi:hypothetical protein
VLQGEQRHNKKSVETVKTQSVYTYLSVLELAAHEYNSLAVLSDLQQRRRSLLTRVGCAASDKIHKLWMNGMHRTQFSRRRPSPRYAPRSPTAQHNRSQIQNSDNGRSTLTCCACSTMECLRSAML